MSNERKEVSVLQTQSAAVSVFDKIGDPIQAAQYLGEQMFNSKLGGFETREQAVVVAWSALVNREDPMRIIQRNHVIQGKLSKKADVMLADFQRRGGRVKWTCATKERVAGTFIKDDNEMDFEFTMQEARDAHYCHCPVKGTHDFYDGQGGRREILKDNWAKDPMGMLKARCISRAVGFLDPEAKGGYSTPEELLDVVGESTVHAQGAPAPRAFEDKKVEDAVVEPASVVQQEANPTYQEMVACVSNRIGAENLESFHGYLRHLKWLKDGEGLPSLSKEHLERLYKSRNVEKAFEVWRNANAKKGGGNNENQ